MPKPVPPPFGGDGDDRKPADSSTTRTGSHRADKTTKRRRFPGPGAIGAAALIVAGAGVIYGTGLDTGTEYTSEPETLSAPLATPDPTYFRGGIPEVSRDVDRKTLERQAEAQARQREAALAEVRDRSQNRASELRKAQERRERRREARQERAEAAEEENNNGDGGVTASGEPGSNQWVLPVTGYSLTATFGESGSYWSSVHTGLDFSAGTGTPLVAVSSGEITSTGYDGSYGNKTVLTLEDGTEIWYCHQDSVDVSTGQTVAPGDTIGTVGATGNVTGPHLHLEVRPGGGEPVDPEAALQEHGVDP